MAAKRSKPDAADVELEDPSDSYLKDGCFPDSDGKHPDELKNGKITLFMITTPIGVITPKKQAEIVSKGGIKPFTGRSLLYARCPNFTGKRDASTVPPDLYRTWYNFFRGCIDLRRSVMRSYEKAVASAKRLLDQASSTYILPGDWQFEPAEDEEDSESESESESESDSI